MMIRGPILRFREDHAVPVSRLERIEATSVFHTGHIPHNTRNSMPHQALIPALLTTEFARVCGGVIRNRDND